MRFQVATAAFVGVCLVAGAASAGNPGKCVCTTKEQVCNWSPGYVQNASPGDIALNVDPVASDFTAQLMAGIEQGDGNATVRTHAGLMLDNANVRHNTMALSSLSNALSLNLASLLESCVLGSAMSPGDLSIDQTALRRGQPGLETTNFADQMVGSSYFWAPDTNGTNGAVFYKVKSQDSAMGSAAASSSAGLTLDYNIFAYTSYSGALIDWGGQPGSMCSGSVLLAWSQSGYTSGLGTQTYSAATRLPKVQAAYILIQDLAQNVLDQMAGNSICDNANNNLYLSQGVAYQIMNAFVFGNFNDSVDTSFFSSPGPGLTVSPDDIEKEILQGSTVFNPVAVAPQPVRGSNKCSIQNVTYPCACP